MPLNKVFIVHGRNETIKTEVFNFLKTFRLSPIILNQEANEGMTVIEKFEKYSNVGYAVVLMTDDDLGKEKSLSDLKARARQNVVLELGYFIAKSRGKICILYSPGVELPSDLGGIVYEVIDARGKWKDVLERELRKAGYDNVFLHMNIPEKTLMLNTNIRPQTGCRVSYLDTDPSMPCTSIDGDYDSTYLDIFFDSHGEVISDIEYTYADFGRFTFYTHCNCQNSKTGENIWRWIQFVTQNVGISSIPNQGEKLFPVKSTPLQADWKKVKVNVREAFEQLFGVEGLIFMGLERMRIRGSGKLFEIVLR
jgi:hypothetical protein